jgi:hypothetical protein
VDTQDKTKTARSKREKRGKKSIFFQRKKTIFPLFFFFPPSIPVFFTVPPVFNVLKTEENARLNMEIRIFTHSLSSRERGGGEEGGNLHEGGGGGGRGGRGERRGGGR